MRIPHDDFIRRLRAIPWEARGLLALLSGMAGLGILFTGGSMGLWALLVGPALLVGALVLMPKDHGAKNPYRDE